MSNRSQINEKLRAENKRLREALARIVDYEHSYCTHPDDLREIAREALEACHD